MSTLPQSKIGVDAPPSKIAVVERADDLQLPVQDGVNAAEQCPHKDVEHGHCLECGLSLSGSSGGPLTYDQDWSGSHQRANSTIPLSIEKDLADKGLPDDVKQLVIYMADQATKETHRAVKRNQRLFSLTYIACLQLGKSVQPDTLATAFGLSKTDVNLALRMVSGTSNKALSQTATDATIAPVVALTPLAFINAIRPYLTEHIAVLGAGAEKDLVVLIEAAVKKNPLLLEENPQWMLVGFLKFYLERFPTIKLRKLHERFGVTAQSLKGCYEKARKACS